MLILSRRVGESIVIGEDISVTVLRVKGNQVRLGVDAPKGLTVQRDGVSERAKPEGVIAAEKSSGEVVTMDIRLSRPGS